MVALNEIHFSWQYLEVYLIGLLTAYYLLLTTYYLQYLEVYLIGLLTTDC